MKLEHISAVLRPRSDAEAVDLGLAMVRRHAGGIFRAWFLLIVPLWGVLAFLLREHPALMVLIAWWLKPLYDRVVTFYLGRALFGAPPGLRGQLGEWRRILTGNLLHSLITARLSAIRSFVLPVLLLEGLQGKVLRTRVKVLRQHGGGAAFGFMSMFGCLEMAATLGLFFAIRGHLPEDWTEWFSTIGTSLRQAGTLEPPLGLLWSVAACYLLATAFLEPFHAGGGFGLYINTRTHLEGWDVDLAFRQISQRLRALTAPDVPPAFGNAPVSGSPSPLPTPPPPSSPLPPPLHLPSHSHSAAPAAAAAGAPPPVPVSPPARLTKTPLSLLALLGSLLTAFPVAAPGSAAAQPVDKEQAAQDIREVLEHPDFTEHVRQYKQWDPDFSWLKPRPAPSKPSPENSGWDWSWLDGIGNSVRAFFSGDWKDVAARLLLAILAVAALFWLGRRFMRWVRSRAPLPAAPIRPAGPRTVMGLEVAPESLPEDVPAAAWKAWQQGDSPGAVRLLYRAALAWLMENSATPVQESDTEGDCLRHARALPDAGRAAYFSRLTGTWLSSAYGRQLPASGEMRSLCDHWPFSLGSAVPSPPAPPPAAGGAAGGAPRQLTALLLIMTLGLTGCRMKEREEELGHQGEAKRNPWLAATRFLENQSFSVQQQRGLMDLPDPQDTLLVVPSSAVHSVPMARHVLDWVSGGGHLLYIAEGGEHWRGDWSQSGRQGSAAQGQHPLLTRLDVTIAAKSASGASAPDHVRIGRQDFRFSFAERVRFDVSKAGRSVVFAAGPETDTPLASLRHNSGRVTLLADGHPFRSRWIDDDDHAALLLALARIDPAPAAVHFIRAGSISLWDMLVEHAWPALMAAAILLLMWLWSVLPRFGPVRAPGRSGSRRFSAHLDEAGAFLWRQRQTTSLLEPARQAVLAAARHHAFRPEERGFANLLAARSGLSPQRVDQALHDGGEPESRQFTRLMADLQILLHSLAPPRRLPPPSAPASSPPS